MYQYLMQYSIKRIHVIMILVVVISTYKQYVVCVERVERVSKELSFIDFNPSSLCIK